MLRNFKKNHQSGFTIIEVLIVLAIAGLIMVAVFTAVPALQRSSRNNARKSSASQIMASVSSYVANNNGNLPSAGTLTNALSDYKPGFYTVGTNIWFAASAGGTTPLPSVGGNGSAATVTTDSALFLPGYVCDANNVQATTANASARSYAVVYAVETGSGATSQCIGS